MIVVHKNATGIASRRLLLPCADGSCSAVGSPAGCDYGWSYRFSEGLSAQKEKGIRFPSDPDALFTP